MNTEQKAEQITDYFIGWLVKDKKVSKEQYSEFVSEIKFMLEND